MSERVWYETDTRYGVVIPLRIEASDKAEPLRKLLREAGQRGVADTIMRTWLENPGKYDVDIQITMTKRN